MDTTQLSSRDFAGTSIAAACSALKLDPVRVLGSRGYTIKEADRAFRVAIKGERLGLPMPSTPAHQFDLARELRLAVARPLVQAVRRCDLEIERLTAERVTLAKLLE